MTSPNKESPENSYGPSTVANMQNVTQKSIGLSRTTDVQNLLALVENTFIGNILSGFISIGQAIGQALNDVANALFGGLAAQDHPALQIINDGQNALIARLDLMDNISGYAVAYMKENRYKDRNKWVLMEFNGQLGPVKNATVTDNGITLAQGTWVINAQCTHDHHVDRMTSRIKIEVLRPDNSVYSIKEAFGEVFPDKWTTRQVSHNVVLPAPGYKVRVWTFYNVGTVIGVYNRLMWRGGTHLTHLMAHRLDIDTSNAVVDENVPTVGGSTGDDG